MQAENRKNSCYLLIVSRFGVQTKQKPIAREKSKIIRKKAKKYKADGSCKNIHKEKNSS